MKTITLQDMALYADQYIAISKDKTEIIASAKNITELHKKLEKIKIEGVIIHYVPPLNVAISPVCQ